MWKALVYFSRRLSAIGEFIFQVLFRIVRKDEVIAKSAPRGQGTEFMQVTCSLGSIRFGSRFSSKMVVYGHCLVTLPAQLMKTLKWFTQLPTLMQSHSGGDSVASRC